jgi:hypothetical protein
VGISPLPLLAWEAFSDEMFETRPDVGRQNTPSSFGIEEDRKAPTLWDGLTKASFLKLRCQAGPMRMLAYLRFSTMR